MEIPDTTLLDHYAAEGDERSFRTLVERHLPLVHGVARRVAENEELARDVAQAVFIRLARQAVMIPADVPLAAWLHRAARNLAIDAVRSEGQRRKRESEVALAIHGGGAGGALMSDEGFDEGAGWAALAPVVDELVNRLPEGDRRLVLLRFYGNESHAAIARRLGLTEEAARKRSRRAVGKLRVLLGRRGIVTTAAALAQMLPAHAAAASAPGYAAGLAGAVLAQGVTPVAPAGLQLFQAMTTSQKAAVALAMLVFAGSAGYAMRGIFFAAPLPMGAVATGSGLAGADAAAGGGREERGRREIFTGSVEQRLQEILAIPGRTQRLQEIFAFLPQLPRERHAEAAGILRGLKTHAADDVLRLLADAWAQRDPAEAAEWARGSDQQAGYGWMMNRVLTAWGAADGARAMDWVMRRRADLTGNADFAAAAGAVLAGAADRDFDEAVRLMLTLPDARTNGQWAIQMIRAAREGRQNVVEDLMQRMDKGRARGSVLAENGETLLRKGEGAMVLRELASDEAAQSVYGIDRFFGEWRNCDRDEARAAIAAMEPGAARNLAVAGWCVADNAPEEALPMAERYPEAFNDDLVNQLAGSLTEGHAMAAGLELTRRMQDAERQEALRRVLLMRWAAKDAAAARGWISTAADLSGVVRERLAAAVEQAGGAANRKEETER